MPILYAVVCAALSGAFFYLSGGLGEVWALAWIAALPVLWLAYGNIRPGLLAAAAFAAFAIGQMNMVLAYWGQLPVPTLAAIAIVPPVAFAVAVLFARFAARRLPAPLAALAFPALWTAWEYIIATNAPDGTAGSFAYSQAGVAEMVQSASVFGIASITFLLMVNASLLAMALRRPAREGRFLAGAALILFGANVLFGVYRLSATADEKIHVAMVNSDALNSAAFSGDGETALSTVRAYVASATGAIRNGAQIVVMPEKMAVVEPAWRYDTLAAVQRAADDGKVTIVAGFDMRGDTRRNAALVFRPNKPVFEYDKRRMVPGLEAAFQPGLTSGMYEPGRAVAVCKDMDFAQMMRDDAQAHIRVMFVPAWDFGADGWAHARMAIMRGVEGGYAIVRTARLGFLTATDAEGRIVSGAPSSYSSDGKSGFVAASAIVPLGPGDTIYLHIGDVLAWACIGLTLVLFLMGFIFRTREAGPTEDESANSDGEKS